MGERGKAGSERQGRVVDSMLATDPVFPCFAVCPGPPHFPESLNLQFFCLPIGGLEIHTSWDAAKQLSLTLPTKQPSPKPIFPRQQLNLRLNKRGA